MAKGEARPQDRRGTLSLCLPLSLSFCLSLAGDALQPRFQDIALRDFVIHPSTS